MLKNKTLRLKIILSLVVIIVAGIIGFVSKFVYDSSPIVKLKRLSTDNKLNFVLINIDSLRADHMGIYGYNKNTTPFLDSLAKQGVVFKEAITPTYLTFQTDAAIFSGLYASQNNVQTWDTPINDNLYLLPKILGLYGYKTAAFVSPSLWEYFGFAKQFDEYTLTGPVKNLSKVQPKVIEWIKNHQDSPSFLFWHIYDVHLPYNQTDTKYISQFNQLITDPKGPYGTLRQFNWQAQTTKSIPTIIGYLAGIAELDWEPLNQDDVDYLSCAYDEGIRYVDAQLKDFFSQIQKLPNYKNTVFIISSEHGEDLKEHGFIFHRDIYDVNTHVPLIIIFPESISEKIDKPVSSLDIMPTILDLAKIKTPENGEGISLLPLIKGQYSKDRPIYTERPPYDEYSVRLGDWKYILRNPNKKEMIKAAQVDNPSDFFDDIIKSDITFSDELYNIKKDPNEQNNLIGKGLPIENQLKELVLAFKTKMTNARAANNIKSLNIPIFTYP